MNRFSHSHPLALYEKGYDEGDEKILCFGCGESISGPSYSCIQCKFFLHKSCAKLPTYIISFLHPRHPLTLNIKKKTSYRQSWFCGHCKKVHAYGFTYNCSICSFNLDIKCASLNENINEPERHQHSFMLLRPTSFICDRCGEQEKDGKSMSYLCTTCQIQFHTTCISLPLALKLKGHVHAHELDLTPFTPVDDSVNYLCQICPLAVNIKFSFYYCAQCNYIAHVGCASNPTPPNIEYFTREHQWTLSNDERKGEEVCDGCTERITTPFYSCAECDFMLHISCFELPNSIVHPLHSQHSLTLLEKVPRTTSVFKCDCCNMYCNGFAYMCDACNFFLDVKCSLVANTLEHEGHYFQNEDHPLTLIPKGSEMECNACGLNCRAKFRCEKCNFNLDLRCASLPDIIEHKCPQHDLKIQPYHLTYFSTDDEFEEEYYCDVCKKIRGKNRWFYNCKDCGNSTHLNCIISKYRIKFEKSYQFGGHSHPLTLVEKTSANPPCNICGDPCKDFVFVCFECDLYVHVETCSDMLASEARSVGFTLLVEEVD